MEKEKMTLSVDTGSVLIDLEDNGEVIGQFRFNPNDIDIVKRYEKVIGDLENITVSENPDSDEIFRLSDEIKKQFDYLLNYNVSSGIFAKCNPFTLTADGDFYFEKVMDGIAGLIEKTMDQRLAKKKAKISKATAKYHK